MKKILIMMILVSMVHYISFAKDLQKAYFAGGCFWCVEASFEEIDGVVEAISGYAGGKIKNPTYKQVSRGQTSYVETVEIIYDADVIDYDTLLNVFWKVMDPTDAGGQFSDRGAHYRPVIFYQTDEEKALAEASKKSLNKSGWFKKEIDTDIVKHTVFYPAEEYHQDYYLKNSVHYKIYRKGSGRDRFLKKIWGKSKLALTDKISKK